MRGATDLKFGLREPRAKKGWKPLITRLRKLRKPKLYNINQMKLIIDKIEGKIYNSGIIHKNF